jgi:hypothetical protein
MPTIPREKYPRLEFRFSAQKFRAALVICSIVVLPTLLFKAYGATVPTEYWPNPVGIVIAWCLVAGLCLAAGTYLFSRIDMSRPVLIIGPDGVSGRAFPAAPLPWSSIHKIKFYETGKFGQTKLIVFKMLEAKERDVTMSPTPLAGVKPKELFERLKAYHHRFGPEPEVNSDDGSVRTYVSSSWTGVEDD